ncbi:MAG: hypothetical protein A2103_00435 [Gammaproteobacteria bacterium GWF2_41_13]|nr:MAG: hypothetical protein A2103_00435 [Gammaproteobacteria bacterium GWF2_41_13]
MANVITCIRLALVFIVIAIALYAAPIWQLMNVPLFVVIIVLDGLDGLIARARQETSLFGAVFDIAADRIIEMSLWILWVELNQVSIWIGLIFVTRGILVDSLRHPYQARGREPFSIMQTALGQFLVASRTMRFLYGSIKLFTFTWLLFLIPAVSLWPHAAAIKWAEQHAISGVLVYITLVLCLLRGIPVVLEAIFIQTFN